MFIVLLSSRFHRKREIFDFIDSQCDYGCRSDKVWSIRSIRLMDDFIHDPQIISQWKPYGMDINTVTGDLRSATSTQMVELREHWCNTGVRNSRLEKSAKLLFSYSFIHVFIDESVTRCGIPGRKEPWRVWTDACYVTLGIVENFERFINNFMGKEIWSIYTQLVIRDISLLTIGLRF